MRRIMGATCAVMLLTCAAGAQAADRDTVGGAAAGAVGGAVVAGPVGAVVGGVGGALVGHRIAHHRRARAHRMHHPKTND